MLHIPYFVLAQDRVPHAGDSLGDRSVVAVRLCLLMSRCYCRACS
jgi:hypothetical protein